jgi:hypothetical protein
MRQTIIAIACTFVTAATAGAQGGPGAMPKAGPEYQRLAYFVGTWNFSGEAKAGPMGPAGPVTFKEVCELMDGGWALVCRSDGKAPTGPTRAVSIMSYDAAKNAYTYTAAESNMPAFTAIGQLAGAAWNWNTEMSMGGQTVKTRVTVTETGPSTYTFTMELAMGSGPFTTMVSGKATKAGK